MAVDDPIAPLVPWYANGTLEPDERKRVEQHLPGCSRCRQLLRQAQRQTASWNDGLAQHTEHVHPTLLTQFVERPESLEPETVGWIEDRLAECETCREAVELLRQVTDRSIADVPPDREHAPSSIRRAVAAVWDALTATVLRPAPALVYLLLLALVIPIWLTRRGTEPLSTDLIATPRAIAMHSQRLMRAPGQTPPEPLEIVVPRSAPEILLELRTDLEERDVRDEESSFELEIYTGDELLWSEQAPRENIQLRESRAVFFVVLNADGLDEGRGHDVVVRVSRPGDPLDRQAVFRRTFVLRRE